jgi:hypothetical protein
LVAKRNARIKPNDKSPKCDLLTISFTNPIIRS